MYIILAILAFGILIITHELGHFTFAKAFKVRVEEFSVGMGPCLFKRRKGETLYSLRALPFGGFCAMTGEDEEVDDPRAFTSQTPIKRMLILAAGPAANFITGLLLLIIVFSQAAGYSAPVISGFMDGCPYEGENALLQGDEIYKVDGHRIYFYTNFSDYMSLSGSDTHDIVIKRGGEKISLRDFYMPLREYAREDGGTDIKYGLYFTTEGASPLGCLKYSWYGAIDFVRIVWRSLGELISGRAGLNEISGPVGIVGYVNEVAEQETSRSDALLEMAYIFALIAVNLAVMNFLPIPAIDGGRIFLLLVTWLIESLTGLHVNRKIEGYIHSVGLVLLMLLMAVVLFSDVFKLIINR